MKRLFTLFIFLIICYDGFSQSWTQLTSIGVTNARNRAAHFAINGKGYIVAGGGTFYLNDCWAYDTLSDSWSQKMNYPLSKEGLVAFAINGIGYTGTGTSGYFAYNNQFFKYDPGANLWTQVATMPGTTSGRSFAFAFTVGGKGYVGGGLNGTNNNALNDFYGYDPVTDMWTTLTSYPGLGNAFRAVAFAIGNKAYVGTGGQLISGTNGSFIPQNDFWEYDPALDQWTAKNPFPGSARESAVGFATCSKGYIGLGYTNQAQNQFAGDFWQYDAGTDTWVQIANYGGTARGSSDVFVMGQEIYVGLGTDGINAWNQLPPDLWRYREPSTNAAAAFTSATTTCAGQAITFTDASNFSPTSWSWTFQGGTPAASGSQNPTVTYNTPGLYSVTLTATSACYSNTITKTNYITVGAPGTLNILPKSPTICKGGTVTLTVSGGNGLVWSPSTGLNTSTGNTVIANPTTTTVYQVNGSGGCTSSGSDSVIVTQPAAVSITPASPSVCAGQGVQLTATGTNITWSPSTGLSQTSGAIVMASPGATTTYTATATGCTLPGTNTVTVTQPVQITINPASPSMCVGGQVVLSATTNGSNITWSPSSGLNQTNGSLVIATPATSTTYTVTSTGCTTPGTVAVTVNQPVPLTITPVSPNICAGTGSASLSASGGTGITWSPPTGLNTTNGGNVTATPATTTVYTATATGGCTLPGTDTVIVNQATTLTITPASPGVCAGQTVTLNATGGTGISWSPSTGLNTVNGSSVIASAPATDSITYTVKGTNAAGCNATGTVTLHKGGSSIPGTVHTLRDTLCAGTPGNLSLVGNSSHTIQWQSSTDGVNFTNVNGGTDTTKFKTQPLLQSTWYFATVGNGACTAESDTIQLYIPPALVAFFGSTETGAKQLTFNCDSSTGKISAYHWDFGDGKTSTEKNPSHTFTKDTTYYVCLTLYDGSNCSYTFCRYLDVVAEGIPTVLTSGNWLIYPNPFGEQLTIALGEAGSKQTDNHLRSVEMYDVLGRLVINQSIDNNANTSLQLDVSFLSKGMYFLVLKTADANYVQKVVKQ